GGRAAEADGQVGCPDDGGIVFRGKPEGTEMDPAKGERPHVAGVSLAQRPLPGRDDDEIGERRRVARDRLVTPRRRLDQEREVLVGGPAARADEECGRPGWV